MGRAVVTMALVLVVVTTAMGAVKTMAMPPAVATTEWRAMVMVVAGADTAMAVEALSREVVIVKGLAVAMAALAGGVRTKVMPILVVVGIEILLRESLVAPQVMISTVRGVVLMVFFSGEVILLQTVTVMEEISNVGTLAVLVLL
jgi:hypothetical protein